MGRRAEYTLLITNPSGSQTVCDPIEAGDPRTGAPGWSEIRLGPRLNEAGSGTITCTARPDILAAVNDPDNRVVARREDPSGGSSTVEMAGPIEMPKHGYEASRDGTDGPGRLTITFADDLVLLTERGVYPNPALAATAQTTTKYTITNVNPEDAARALVYLQAGPGAHTSPDRRTPGLVLGPDNNVLPGVTISTSFTRDVVLSDALREVVRLGAVAADVYPRRPRLRIIHAAGQLQFVVEMPPDLSDAVIFSRALGNVEMTDYAPESPRDTVAIVGDATAGPGRIVKERTNADAHAAGWRRREVWVDARGAANAAELEQAGDDVLAEGGPKVGFTLRAIDTAKTRYGYDYPLGAMVAAEPYEGQMVSALVMGADITVTAAAGEDVVPIVGVDGDQVDDRKAAEIRRILRRLGSLEGAL
ncbi:hypothetical protein AB0A95_30680 [Micromonospora sp. NPDC049230]|uniref:Gp37-like protein n=1 Tax=Micromonospora sp. NPDC049230 TaxID=3155502 RepID=UPI0033F59DE6